MNLQGSAEIVHSRRPVTRRAASPSAIRVGLGVRGVDAYDPIVVRYCLLCSTCVKSRFPRLSNASAFLGLSSSDLLKSDKAASDAFRFR